MDGMESNDVANKHKKKQLRTCGIFATVDLISICGIPINPKPPVF